MLEINTGKYLKAKKILVDGHTWTMKLPGAGEELAMSQATRRIKQLDAKIEAGTMTDEDYDKYDRLENQMYAMFSKMFQDGTPENKTVSDWLKNTPMAVVQLAIEDIKKQADDNKEQAELNNAAQAAKETSTAPDPATA